MKKKILLPVVFLLFLTTVVPYTVLAQQNRIGVGAIIGTPNGISVKSWVDEDLAVDGALSFTFGENSSSLYLHSDILFHKNLDDEGLDVERGSLNFYYGAGIRLRWIDAITDDLHTGIRGPVGFAYSFEQSKAELFFELVPTIDIHPLFRFSFAGAVGARYYLSK